MNIETLHNVYFIGIGGIGMSAIARYFKYLGKNIAGYDRTSTLLTETLEKEGIDIHYEDDLNLIPQNFKINNKDTLIIYTPAIPKDHKELNYFQNTKFEVIKRSKALGLIISHKKGIAIAGTHGKTTISCIIAHIFNNSDYGCNAFLGGISSNYNTNLIANSKSDYVIVEADEFDKSFLQLNPCFAIISAIDADHLDIYGERKHLVNSFNQFAGQVSKNGKLLIKNIIADEISSRNDILKYTYSLHGKSDFYIREIKLVNGKYIVALASPFGVIKDIEIGIPGLVNVENAVAAIAVAMIEGIESIQIKKSLASFMGVKRRFEYMINIKELVFIDDYAHHPEELKACINSVKDLFPGKKITGIFQPHLYSRTRDFANGFAESLSLLDELILLDIYPAREGPIEGVTSKIIFDKVKLKNKLLTTKQEFWQQFTGDNCEVVLTLGAGDIDKMVEPIKKLLLKKME